MFGRSLFLNLSPFKLPLTLPHPPASSPQLRLLPTFFG
ncbi:unnamed protein product [Arabidopsis thaliana]|uniref:(thale cress) hypothetical protein n=1 Tax=Arabidopsis thaliana TaxID=3702 RepID=A0A7G2FDS2_ARATH|nr:unnamed protein product [Arabidopsis thaliana]